MLGVDEKFGGTPVDVTTLMLVSERICKNGAPIYVYGNLCALKDMTEYGTPEQQEQCFAEVMAGKPGFVLGFTEPGAGSDSSSLASTYQRRDGKVYLNGSKSFMTNAVNSKYMLCVARDADDDPEDRANRSRFSMWWVPLQLTGDAAQYVIAANGIGDSARVGIFLYRTGTQIKHTYSFRISTDPKTIAV